MLPSSQFVCLSTLNQLSDFHGRCYTHYTTAGHPHNKLPFNLALLKPSNKTCSVSSSGLFAPPPPPKIRRYITNTLTWCIVSLTRKPLLHFLRLCEGHSSPNDYHPFPVLKRNLDGRMFNGDDVVQTAVTRLLETQDTD
jgi:hypothetical protein